MAYEDRVGRLTTYPTLMVPYYSIPVIRSMERMMTVLRRYEFVSGQMVNLTKSYLYLH